MNRSARLIEVVVVLAGAAYVACGAHAVLDTNNTNSAGLTAIDPASVGGVQGGITFAPCRSGTEHPNICCGEADGGAPGAGIGGAATCGDYPGDPFRPCPSGTSTYPDPRSCCDLGDGGCTPAPETPLVDAAACYYNCPPGYVSGPAVPYGRSCCPAAGSGAGCLSFSMNVVKEGPDGAAIDVTPPSTCSQCPGGFSPVPGPPGVCCGNISGVNGTICFSIAVGAITAAPGVAGLTSDP